MSDTEVANKAAIEAQIVEEKVMKTVEQVESSKLSKSLPTEFAQVRISDITKMIMIISFSNFLPLFIIFGRKFENKAEYLRIPTFVAFNITIVILFAINLIAYISGIQEMYKFVLGLTMLKGILMSVLIVMTTFGQGWLKLLVGIFYVGYIAFTDLLLLYYLAIYLKRSESPEYDDYGVPIQEEETRV